MTERVYMHEVVPRDGLQNEDKFVSTEKKVDLINRLSRTGVSKIEVSSFVSPKAVPQMKDAQEVFDRIERIPGVTYVALAPNVKGAEKAVAAAADEINVFLSVSATHNMANVRKTHVQSLAEFEQVLDLVSGTDVQVNGTLSTVFGCPYEGEIDEEQVLHFVETFLQMGMDGITLADTTGMAHPGQVRHMIERVKQICTPEQVTLHFHNTRGMGLANVVAGLEAGIRRFDASLAGLGGCPFAPGATGNICTEDTVHMLEAMGYDTGVDLDLLIEQARIIPDLVDHDVPGQVMTAGKRLDVHPIPAHVQQALK